MEYRDVVGYEGLYLVSNTGRVKSVSRSWSTGKNNHIIVLKPRILKPNISNGYYMVNLSKEGKVKRFTIHGLVAASFLNHKPCGSDLVVDHVNDNKLDNNLLNLQIVTTRFNSRKTPKSSYSSKYKGVSWDKRNKKWKSSISIGDKKIHLGLFKDELKAHEAYQNRLINLI